MPDYTQRRLFIRVCRQEREGFVLASPVQDDEHVNRFEAADLALIDHGIDELDRGLFFVCHGTNDAKADFTRMMIAHVTDRMMKSG